MPGHDKDGMYPPPGIVFLPLPGYALRMGTLYYGDNLDILRRYPKDETVNLV